MKVFYLFIAIAALFSPNLFAQDFYYSDDGKTLICDDATIGDTITFGTAIAGQVTFTKRSKEQITPENAATSCTSGITDMSGLFKSQSGFNTDIAHWDVSSVTNMSEMFSGARVFDGDLSGWDVSAVTDMSEMFAYATSFSGTLASWDVSAVTSMRGMFRWAEAYNNAGISAWNVAKVTDMAYMFENANSLVGAGLSAWDVSSVTDFSFMFSRATLFNADISSWNTASATNLEGMLSFARAFNQDLSNWNVANVTNMASLFTKAALFNSDLGSWNVAKVTSMQAMFDGATAFNQDVSGWNVGAVTNTSFMFAGASAFNQDLSEWDVSSVSNMTAMFTNATAFSQDLSSWDVSQIQQEPMQFAAGSGLISSQMPKWGLAINPNIKLAQNGVTVICDDAALGESGDVEIYGTVINFTKRSKEQITPANAASTCTSGITDLSSLFGFNTSFNANISHWDVSDVTNFTWLFFGASSFNQDLGNWDVSNATSFEGAFGAAKAFNQDLSQWNVSSVTNMEGMFNQTDVFNANISSWNVANVTTMRNMFGAAKAFNQAIGSWDVSSVTDMEAMFFNADNFNQEIGAWNVSVVTTMKNMFNGAKAFNKPLANWDVSAVTNMEGMFASTTAFSQNLSGWDVAHIAQEPSNFAIESALTLQQMPRWGLAYNPNFKLAENGITVICDDAALGESGDLEINGSVIGFTKRSKEQITPENAATSCISGITDLSSLFGFKTTFNANISHWDVSEVTNFSYLFFGATSFNQDLGNWDVSNATSFEGAFAAAKAFNQNLSQWNVSSVTNMEAMFNQTDSFNGDISNWNVANVINMRSMFGMAKAFNEDISSWNVSKVTNMEYMFGEAVVFNQNLGSWNVSSVLNFDRMFTDAASFSQDLTSWEVAHITTEPADFAKGSGLTPAQMPKWGYSPNPNFKLAENGVTVVCNDAALGESGDIYINDKVINFTKRSKEQITPENAATTCTSGVTDISTLFGFNTAFNEDISHWDVSAVTNMSYLFFGAINFNQDLSSWDVSKIQNMEACFGAAKAFNQDLSSWDVSSVTNMEATFNQTDAFNGDISSWDVANVTTMKNMFGQAKAFNQPIGGWDVSSVTDMEFMFGQAVAFNQNLGSWNVSNVENMKQMFNEASSFSQDLSAWDVTHIPTEPKDFATGSTLSDAQMPRWGLVYNPNFKLADNGVTVVCDDAKVGNSGDLVIKGTIINFTKRSKEQITEENAATTCTSGISDMSNLFHLKTDFNEDISHWDVSDVTDMSFMFAGKPRVDANSWDKPEDYERQVRHNFNRDISYWDVSSVTNMEMMFSISNFNNKLSNWDVSSVKNMRGMFSISPFNQPIGDWDVSAVTDMADMFAGDAKFAGEWTFGAQIFTIYFINPFNQDLSKWDVSSVENMKGMFSASNFNGSISTWNTSNVENMSVMFAGNRIFFKSISNWDVSNVKNMDFMFLRNNLFNDDISKWDVSSLQTCREMFAFSGNFNQNLSSWDLSGIAYANSMFRNAKNFNNGNAPKFKKHALAQTTSINTLPWDLSNAQDVSGMFAGAESFDADISSWNLGNAKQLDELRSAGDTLLYYNGKMLDQELLLRLGYDQQSPETDSLGRSFLNGIPRDSLAIRVLTKDTLIAGFLQNTGMSTENVDKLVTSLAQQNLQPTVTSITTYPSQVSEQGAAALEQLVQNTGVQVTTGGVRTEVALTQDIRQGWNLISLPVQQESTATTDLFPWADPNLVYGFDKTYMPVDTLSTGIGYWVYSDQTRNIDWNDFSHPPMIRRVDEGWNLLGSSSFNLPLSELVDPLGLLATQQALGYSSAQNQGNNNTGGYQSISQVQPGEGYWIKSRGAGQIDIPFNVPEQQQSKASQNQKIAQTQGLMQLSPLNITVSDGQASMELSLGQAAEGGLSQVHAEDRLLPPAPPQGAFDARISANEQGYRVKVLSDEGQEQRIPISYSSSTSNADLTLNWNPNELLDERIYTIESGEGSQVYSADLRSLNGSFEPAQAHVSMAAGLVLVIKPLPITSTKDEESIPNSFNLAQNYPNPFNPTTTISFSLAEPAMTTLEVYNVQGQMVSRLVNEAMSAGKHHVVFDAAGLPTGVYVYRLVSGAQQQMRKLLLIK